MKMNAQARNEENAPNFQLEPLSSSDESRDHSIEPQLLLDVQEDFESSIGEPSFEIQDAGSSEPGTGDLSSLVQEILMVEKEFEYEVQIHSDTEKQDPQSEMSQNKEEKLESAEESTYKDEVRTKLKTNENGLIRRLHSQNRL